MDTDPIPAASPSRTTPSDATVAAAVEHVRRLVQSGAPRRDALARLAMAAEALAGPGSTASILVIDEEGLLRNGASPNLPPDYLDAIDRLRPDPRVGTCAAAAATGEVVITPDFATDEKWAELRHLPASLGYTSAWSQPIVGPDGRVLGTFGTYFRQQRTPTERERSGVAELSAVAATVLVDG